ncbi:antibiotic biosynthesis monooxygenase [Streptomyces sp. NPDC001982]|uniref:putative quinol monooxygenase n=1 Tax=Streptomyces sp. NPDC001982 TaxID=3154405 RepID=UPI00331BA96C
MLPCATFRPPTKPDQRSRFLAAVEDNTTCSVRDEPGCLRFKAMRDTWSPVLPSLVMRTVAS